MYTTQRLLSLAAGLLLCTAVTACDHLAHPATNQNNPNAGAVVSQALPPEVAGAPLTLNLPRRMQKSPPLYAHRDNGNLEVGSHVTGWRGRIVKIYYVPPRNVSDNGQSFILESSVNLQQLATAVIQQNGTWHATWKPKSRVSMQPVYLLAQTDSGQVGLVKVGQRNA